MDLMPFGMFKIWDKKKFMNKFILKFCNIAGIQETLYYVEFDKDGYLVKLFLIQSKISCFNWFLLALPN